MTNQISAPSRRITMTANNPRQSPWLATKWQHHGLILLLFSIAIKQAVFVWAVPPWEVPDEPTHFQYVQILAEEHRLPLASRRQNWSNELYRALIERERVSKYGQLFTNPGDIINPSSPNDRRSAPPSVQPNNRAAPYAPLYYLYEAIPYQLLASQSLMTRLYGMRLASSLLLLLVVWLAWKTMRRLGADDALAWTVAAVIGWQPMLGYMFAGVNNDALAVLLGTLVLMILAGLWREAKPRWPQALWLGVIIGLGFANKQHTIIFLPVVLIFWWHIRSRLPSWQWLKLAAITITCVAVIGLGWNIWQATISPTNFLNEDLEPKKINTMVTWPLVLNQYFFHRSPFTLVSFWGQVGWNDSFAVWDIKELYLLLWLAGLVAGVGLNRSAISRRWPLTEPGLARLVGYGLVSLVIMEALFFYLFANNAWRYHILFFPAHGRYYFPIILPLMALLVLGLAALVPARRRSIVYSGVVGSMVILTIALLPVIRRL